MFYAGYTALYPDGATDRINQKQVGGKFFPDASKPSDVKRLRKLAASKLSRDSTTELEAGEVQRNPEIFHQVHILLQKPDDSRKRAPLITSALPKKIPRVLEQGSTSQPSLPTKEPSSKPAYQSTHDDQMPRYDCYHPTNHGSKVPIVPDTAVS